eukprot:11204516-Heterocapsa_arctica.AAC.1
MLVTESPDYRTPRPATATSPRIQAQLARLPGRHSCGSRNYANVAQGLSSSRIGRPRAQTH